MSAQPLSCCTKSSTCDKQADSPTATTAKPPRASCWTIATHIERSKTPDIWDLHPGMPHTHQPPGHVNGAQQRTERWALLCLDHHCQAQTSARPVPGSNWAVEHRAQHKQHTPVLHMPCDAPALSHRCATWLPVGSAAPQPRWVPAKRSGTRAQTCRCKMCCCEDCCDPPTAAVKHA